MAGTVKLPEGVVIGAGRETSQTNSNNQVVQGMIFPITLPSGSTTSVFVPYSEIHDAGTVQNLIDARVNAVMAISG